MSGRPLVAPLVALLVVGCNESALRREQGESDAATSDGGRCLTLVSWNDLHGSIGPDDALLDTGRVPAGGVIALADAVFDVRERGDDVVIVDAGDEFTGPLESTLAEGAPIVAAYRRIGVDAAALGNHDFDFGPLGYARVTAKGGVGDEAGVDGPRGALFARMASASYPYLSANLHRIGGASPGWPNFAASTIVVRGAWRVGVVGYTTRETPTTTLTPNVADLDFATNAAPAVAAEIHKLREVGAAPVVLLAHASLEGALPQSLDEPSDPDGVKRVGELATLVAGLGDDRPDLIVAGHRHAWMLGRVRGVPIVSSDQHGVGLARSRFCKVDGKVKLHSVERQLVFSDGGPRTPLGAAVAFDVAPWIDRVRADAEVAIATLQATCLHQSLDGNAYAEQVARALAEHVADARPAPAGVPVVAMVNAGGLRAPLLKGTVRLRDLFAAFPFENSVAVCATTEGGLAHALDNALARPAAKERFPVGLFGAKLSVRRAADGTPTRTKLEVVGATKDRNDPRVWLAIPDFLLWGGDGILDGVVCEPAIGSSTRVRDAWRTVLAREQGGCEGPAKNVVVAH